MFHVENRGFNTGNAIGFFDQPKSAICRDLCIAIYTTTPKEKQTFQNQNAVKFLLSNGTK